MDHLDDRIENNLEFLEELEAGTKGMPPMDDRMRPIYDALPPTPPPKPVKNANGNYDVCLYLL